MAATLTIADVEKVAKLANLSITKKETEIYARQLADVIKHVEQLAEVNADNIPPTFQVIDETTNIFREDEIKKSLSQEDALSCARETHEGYFVAKGVFSD